MSVFQWVIDGVVIVDQICVLILGTIAFLIWDRYRQGARIASPDEITQVGSMMTDVTRYTVPEDPHDHT